MSLCLGSFVQDKTRPDIPLWVVIERITNLYLLRSIPDEKGNYEIIRSSIPNIIPVVTKIEAQGKYNLKHQLNISPQSFNCNISDTKTQICDIIKK